MIVAVFFVAAAMMAGGAWAVFTGWELIIIERGWTQVLLGGMLVTGGLLLAGIGVLAVHVKRLAGTFEQISAAKPLPAVAAAPAAREEMPPPPPPYEPRSAPPEGPRLQVEPAPVAAPAEETGKAAAPGMSAPAAIALGAAAGAGTAAIASAMLSSSTEARPPAEDDAANRNSSERLFADIEEPAPPVPGDEIAPKPDGEESTIVPMSEGADAGAGATPEGEEHAVPPVEEPARLDDASEETERQPSNEQEELYSAPNEEPVEDAVHADSDTLLPPETARDIEEPLEEEPLEEEKLAVAGTTSDEPAQQPSEVEGPLMDEDARLEGFQTEEETSAEPEPAPRSIVGTYESGGNVYTMYSDGSIDAQTPSGDYHFASLDELKNFIAEGGEDPTA